MFANSSVFVTDVTVERGLRVAPFRLKRSEESLHKSEDVLKRVVKRDSGDTESVGLTPVPDHSRDRHAIAEDAAVARQPD
jgi:hypothetical protein